MNQWEREKAADEAVPDSHRLAHTGAIGDIQTYLDATWSMFHGFDAPPHWLQHDEHSDEAETYCYECASTKMDELDARDGWVHPELQPENEPEDDGWTIAGGGDESEQNQATCETCGRTLTYYLEDGGALDELYHFETHATGALTTCSEGHEVRRLAQWALMLGPSRLEEVKRVAAVIGRVDLVVIAADAAGVIAGLLAAEEAMRTTRRQRETDARENLREALRVKQLAA